VDFTARLELLSVTETRDKCFEQGVTLPPLRAARNGRSCAKYFAASVPPLALGSLRLRIKNVCKMKNDCTIPQ
jgi:hypothetical protein